MAIKGVLITLPRRSDIKKEDAVVETLLVVIEDCWLLLLLPFQEIGKD